MNEKPQATEKVIVERMSDRFVTVHSANEDVLDFIRDLPCWQYPHHVEKHRNAPSHIYGRISPLYDLETTIAWFEAISADDIVIERESGLTPEFFADFDDNQIAVLVDLAPVDDESDGE